MSQIRLCTEILPNGVQCTQIALLGQPWCRAHSTPNQRERNADTRKVLAMIANADLFSVAIILGNTIHEFRTRVIPPLHAETIFEAAATRLDQLIVPPSGPSRPAHNSSDEKRLHVVPSK